MKDLWHHAHTEEDKVRALAFQHSRLVAIHPFPDGNGRISRMATDFAFTTTFGNEKDTSVTRSEYIESLNSAISYDNIGRLSNFFSKQFTLDVNSPDFLLSDYKVSPFPDNRLLEPHDASISKIDRGPLSDSHIWVRNSVMNYSISRCTAK